jgi:hypothetical protein
VLKPPITLYLGPTQPQKQAGPQWTHHKGRLKLLSAASSVVNASCGSLLASTSWLPAPVLRTLAAVHAACMCAHTWWQPDAYVPWSLPRHDMQHATSQGRAADQAPGPDRLLLAGAACAAASTSSWCCVADGTTGRCKKVCRSNLLSAATIGILSVLVSTGDK